MLSVREALEIVLKHAAPLPPRATPLTSESVGLVLAEDVASDIDSPPFDKAMMDGFALCCADLRDGQAELTIIEEIPAGKTPTVEVKAGQASRIMTGAPIPHLADAVVMIERCELLPNQRVRIEEPRIKPRLNILERAKEMRVGEIVLNKGARLRPQEFGLLAAVGRTTVQVQPAPRVAILSTGDEIVEPQQKPGPGQIRNSNASMLLAQVTRARQRRSSAAEDCRRFPGGRADPLRRRVGGQARPGSRHSRRAGCRSAFSQSCDEAGQTGVVWRQGIEADLRIAGQSR
jgi:molybdopterin molybdotransferase